MVIDIANVTIAIEQEVTQLPSNGATANLVDLDLLFRDHTILNANIRKTVRASKNAQLF